MTTPSVWPAPAKINRFLHVTGRRADGYHTLQTLFQFISLADDIHITPTADARIERVAGAAAIAPEADLVVRAARALQAGTGSRSGARIAVSKRIPVGGGLGGGSSDAATTLVALNALWRTGLDTAALARIGLELGADVPVFIGGQAAWAEGIGELLTPVTPDTPWFVLVDPGVAVATATVFAAPELTRNTPHTTIRRLDEGPFRNDCEAVVTARYPEVARALDWLAGFAPARLTGTGGCVLAAVPTRAAAEAAVAAVPPGWRAWAVRGRNRSPLLDRLASFCTIGA